MLKSQICVSISTWHENTAHGCCDFKLQVASLASAILLPNYCLASSNIPHGVCISMAHISPSRSCLPHCSTWVRHSSLFWCTFLFVILLSLHLVTNLYMFLLVSMERIQCISLTIHIPILMTAIAITRRIPKMTSCKQSPHYNTVSIHWNFNVSEWLSEWVSDGSGVVLDMWYVLRYLHTYCTPPIANALCQRHCCTRLLETR